MAQRLYLLKHKTTGKFFNGVRYSSHPTDKRRKKGFYPEFTEKPQMVNIDQLNHNLNTLFRWPEHISVLDDLEMITYEKQEPKVVEKPILTYNTIRRRLEAKEIMSKLKAGV